MICWTYHWCNIYNADICELNSFNKKLVLDGDVVTELIKVDTIHVNLSFEYTILKYYQCNTELRSVNITGIKTISDINTLIITKNEVLFSNGHLQF